MSKAIEIPVTGDDSMQVWLCEWPEWCSHHLLSDITACVKNNGVVILHGDELDKQIKIHRDQKDDCEFRFATEYTTIYKGFE